MQIYSSRLADGRQLPILFRTTPSQPLLVPFLFVTLKRQYKAFNTIRNDLIAIQAFYEFQSQKAPHLDVDELIINGQLSALIEDIEQFLAWISVGRKAPNIVGRIGKRELGQFPGISPTTRDKYLKSLKGFFIWCSQRYSHRAPTNKGLEHVLSLSAESVTSRFDSFLVSSASHQVDFKSLSDDEIAVIREFSHPLAPKNPFRKKNRFRNWLILEIFIETGIRIGETALLTTTSISKGQVHCYLSVINRPDAGEDPRAKKPSLKNAGSQRTIGISEPLYEKIQAYIIHERRPLRLGRPMKLKNGYLWVSERGNPLALNSIASMFSTLVHAIQADSPKLLESASPHSFRHTFAEHFLEYLIEVKGLDMERAKDELRMICGWTDSSDMPLYYTRRYVHNVANEHNSERVSSAWDRLKSTAVPSPNKKYAN